MLMVRRIVEFGKRKDGLKRELLHHEDCVRCESS
jgi:hypothetical protein